MEPEAKKQKSETASESDEVMKSDAGSSKDQDKLITFELLGEQFTLPYENVLLLKTEARKMTYGTDVEGPSDGSSSSRTPHVDEEASDIIPLLSASETSTTCESISDQCYGILKNIGTSSSEDDGFPNVSTDSETN